LVEGGCDVLGGALELDLAPGVEHALAVAGIEDGAGRGLDLGVAALEGALGEGARAEEELCLGLVRKIGVLRADDEAVGGTAGVHEDAGVHEEVLADALRDVDHLAARPVELETGRDERFFDLGRGRHSKRWKAPRWHFCQEMPPFVKLAAAFYRDLWTN